MFVGRKYAKIILILIIFNYALSVYANAATYYVSDNCSSYGANNMRDITSTIIPAGNSADLMTLNAKNNGRVIIGGQGARAPISIMTSMEGWMSGY